MGWRGAIRSYGAAVRAAERDSRRRQRELERQWLQMAKLDALQRAALEVNLYENHVERLRSLHKESSERINWNERASARAPKKPERTDAQERTARYEADTYSPNWFDRLFKREVRKRARLAEAVDSGRAADDAAYRSATDAWTRLYKEWEDETAFARRVLAGEEAAYVEVVKEMNPFSEISNLGTGVSFETVSPRMMLAKVATHGVDVVPKEAKTLLKSGNLSVKELPIGKFHELHQDYICSCALRIANELFAILPLSMSIVTATEKLLNTETGHVEEQPVLSVAIPRSTLEQMNLDAIDPSDAMRQFVHHMDFKKTRGFAPVDRVDPFEVDA